MMFPLQYWIAAYSLLSWIAAYSLLSSKRSKFISKNSSFFIMSTFAVLKVRMPISIGITASVSYVSANGVSPLLDLIMVRGPTQRSHGWRKDFLFKIPFVIAYLPALRRIDLAFFFSSGRISSARWAKLVDVILLSAFAFLFSPLALNLNLRAHVNSTSSGFVSISPALEPSMHDDPSETFKRVPTEGLYLPIYFQKRIAIFGVEPIAIVCFGYSGWISTLIFPFATWSIRGCCVTGPKTIMHSSGIILLLCNVTILLVTRNFSISWAVDGTAWILLTPGLPMISLYRDGDLTTMKFIHAGN
ncbi:hypothetical protein Tco_1260172 [Tanacetum coccineum]